ncbi:MAG: DNA translocase FtsK [Candidatus Nomurabacteria bacterium]|jgi:S-DNA-T family DNA segregation ATPase FtsK/SpoIIIE|nr:DNA translocase FtsK [Candidatus Nomurabacteria bacterium]
MAKKKKRRGPGRPPKKSIKPRHEVPGGFWPQVGAILLLVFSLILLVGLFNWGGRLPVGLAGAARWLMGWMAFVLPFLLALRAIQILRDDENRLGGVIWFATIIFIFFGAGLFQLMLDSPLSQVEALAGDGGGALGWLLDSALLNYVNVTIAAVILSVLILVLLLFTISTEPMAIFHAIARFFGRGEADENRRNEKVAKAVKAADDPKPAKLGELKLNEGVPTVNHSAADPKHSRPAEKDDEPAPAALTAASDPDWELPKLELLDKKESPADVGDVEHNAEIIAGTLAEFNIRAQMEGANIGPKVTQYTLKPPSGVKLTKISALENNIALNLGAQSLRIEAPIPGKKAVGIEVPNLKPADVRLFGILNSRQWKNAREPLSFAIGRDISGAPILGELNKMPHLLIAGQTGSGKSVMINSLLCSLLYRRSPNEMRLILVDPKQVEMSLYNDIPHLLTPVITSSKECISALSWAVGEMERRYTLLAEQHVRDIKSYNNKKPEESMPYIVIVIDELSDLMMTAARDVEALIVRLAQKARAVGVHLVLATQRPSVDVITGLIKANIPARIAFTVASQVDSRTILDQIGAEKLLGAGDMLLQTANMNKPRRVQGAFVSDDEVTKITHFLRLERPPEYNEDIIKQNVQINGKGGVTFDVGGGQDGEYEEALRVVIAAGKASTSLLQRRLRIGYSKASRIIDEMEQNGVVGPPDGSRPREVLVDSLPDDGE